MVNYSSVLGDSSEHIYTLLLITDCVDAGVQWMKHGRGTRLCLSK